jgi:8-oxo-dGTP pyrophosphatase MutT (NUDIX family)
MQPDTVAIVTPDGDLPAELNGFAVSTWIKTPGSSEDWDFLAKSHLIEEPTFDLPSGYLRAAGAVVLEADGRVWIVAPSNAFAGYQATFPKGTADSDMSLQATALKETFEESGLQVRLIRHLIDVRRSQSYTRYYLASRVGGNPSAMGWETQAVMLVPRDQLASVVTHPNDALILEAIGRLGEQVLP